MKRHYCRIMPVLLCLFLCVSVCAASDVSDQAALIAKYAKLWRLDTFSDPWGFTITDLNRNGRPEIISAVLQGTGLYTTFQVLEVNEAGTGLQLIEQPRQEGASAPDIMVSNVICYADQESGRYYTIFEDMLRNGHAEYYESKYAVFIEEGIWHEELLASKNTLYTDETHFTVSCYDAERAEIDEAQYDGIADHVFENLPKTFDCLTWYMTDTASFDALSYGELASILKDLQSGKCVNPAL